jgi:hypothetical protein
MGGGVVIRERAREVIDRYLARYPQADEAARTSAEFAHDVALLRRLLHTLDLVMEDEGVGEPARTRILRTVLYGAADPDAAVRHEERVKQLVQRMESGASLYPRDGAEELARRWGR